jgi:tRNA(fMet)-specific endonuclease VapC
MEARFLLDTNTCIYIRRQRPPQVLARFRQLNVGEAALSIVTYGELHYGAEKSSVRARALKELEEFAGLIPVLPLPTEAGRTYGAIRAALEAKGEIIGSNDLWIAAHAKAADLTLVTNNEREFRRVPGLRIQNWIGQIAATD